MIYRYLLLHHMHGSAQPGTAKNIYEKRTSSVLAGWIVCWSKWMELGTPIVSNVTCRELFKYANAI